MTLIDHAAGVARPSAPAAQSQTSNERPAAHESPLRTMHMKDSQGKKKRKRPGERAPAASPDGPAVSYTPEQRRLIRNGLRIWARVAIRSYLRKHGAGSQAEGSGEEED